MKVMLHAASIEYADDSVEPGLHIAATLDELRALVRDEIEGMAMDEDYEDVWEYISGPGLSEPDWETWHSTMHDMDGTPWVTFFEREVEIPIAVRHG